MGLLDTATKPLREAGRLGSWAAGRGMDAVSSVQGRIRPGSTPKDLDDVTIARKVESEVFRDPAVPKGSIDVNVVDAVVFLRGTAENPAQVRSIEAAVRAVPEVHDVENLLHLPRTPARTSATEQPPMPRAKPRRVNADKTSPRTGDSPVELARARKGRPPAKLG